MDLLPPATALVPAPEPSDFELPPLIQQAGPAAVFAAEEFFFGTIRNPHTRAAYLAAIRRFLRWAEEGKLTLEWIAPRDVGRYFDGLSETTGIATRKQHLAALRHFFDGLVTRHAMVLNPALSVRGERYQVVEGKTPEITVAQARQLLQSHPDRRPDRPTRSRPPRHLDLYGFASGRRGEASAGALLSCR